MLILQEEVIISDTQMRSLVETSWEEENKEGDLITKKGTFWLLHFGLNYNVINTEHGLIAVNYTVAICQDCETGQLRYFTPDKLRVIGTEIKK